MKWNRIPEKLWDNTAKKYVRFLKSLTDNEHIAWLEYLLNYKGIRPNKEDLLTGKWARGVDR